jgi:hypothetical protein
MATFYEIYQNYLQNPYGGVNALPGVNAISGTMGATPISSMSGGDGVGEVSSVNPVGSVSNVSGFGNVDTSPKGIAGLAASAVLGGPAGLALNIGAQLVGVPSLSEIGKATMNALGFSRTDSDFATAGVFGGDDSSSTGTANATDTGDMGSEAANDAASASAAAGGNDGGGADSAGDGGDGYATGGRVGYAEGSITQEGVIPGFTKLKNPDGAPGNYNEFMYEGPDGQIYGAGTYSSIAAGQYPNIYDPSKYTVGPDGNTYEIGSGRLAGGFTDSGSRYMIDFDKYYRDDAYRNEIDNLAKQQYDKTTPTMGEPGGIITDGGLRYRINADGSRTLLDTAIEQTTPTVAEQIISTNNSSPALTSVAETLFPQGNFLNIKKTATSPTEYNIEATKDLVENLPGGTVKDIVAPTAAFALSLPYDAIQAYQRMEPGSGIQGFGKAFQAERPLESAFERFTGAAGPLAENINTAISSLNPFQKQQYMNYAVQNPDQAIAAAQQNKDFLAATQKNTNPATPAPASMADGGRVFYLQGGLASLLG